MQFPCPESEILIWDLIFKTNSWLLYSLFCKYCWSAETS